MSNKRLLEWDPETRTQTWFDYDPLKKQYRVIESQDVEPILEANKRLLNDDGYQAAGIKKDWMHAARIPNAVIMKWKREYGIDVYNKDHIGAVKRLLNSPDWRYLRTGTAKL